MWWQLSGKWAAQWSECLSFGTASILFDRTSSGIGVSSAHFSSSSNASDFGFLVSFFVPDGG